MKEDHVSTSEGDNREAAAAVAVDDNGVGPGHKRLGSASSDSSEDPLTESPAVQLMERKSDAGSEENSHYRFPSSVFSRTKSNTGKEWSINSTESLFSIHMGNMSFTKDLYWIGKSGELGKNGEPLMNPHSPLPDLPPPPTAADSHSHQPPHQHALPDYSPPNPNTLPEGGKRNTNLDQGLCATPEAVETMKSILMENSGQKKESVPVQRGPSSASLPRSSNESRDSTTSFAFPILTGTTSSKKNRQPPPKAREEPTVESPKPPTPKPSPSPAAAGQAKWLGCSCFSCCSGGAS